MPKITNIKARQIFDSRGNPTVEVDLWLDDSSFGRADVPSGASTGAYEAVELRDGDMSTYLGKGVIKAVKNVTEKIYPEIQDTNFTSQKELDDKLIDLDGTENKSNLGANAILGVSLAFSKAMANSLNLELFEYFAKISETQTSLRLPVPMMNILNGGQHADSSVDIQEFMIAPIGADSFAKAMQMGVEVYHSLKKILKENNLSTAVGDEGGFAPNLKSNEDALKFIIEAIELAGYKRGVDISICLDVAATELYKDEKYYFEGEGREFTSEELIDYYKDLVSKYPIIFIEDGLSEDDWGAWQKMTEKLGDKIGIVGDDLYVTNTEKLKRGIEEKSSTSILIKLNQIGTVSETIDAVKLAQDHNMKAVVSHRSGETEDTTIADFSVGLNTGYIKTGAPCRTDRVCKYNQLLRIEEKL